MSEDDLLQKRPPVGTHTQAEQDKKTDAEPEKSKGVPMLTKVIGLGAFIAAAVFLAKKFKGKGLNPNEPPIIAP